MNNIDNLIENLNKEQKEAVLSTEGPNLIVAGAGSGKTRVLTTRLIHIINQKKAWPNQILCVTFTNKAAKEMQNRVMQYVKGSSNSVPWLGTFHSISVKFLRRHAEALGYKSNFTIWIAFSCCGFLGKYDSFCLKTRAKLINIRHANVDVPIKIP